MDESLSNRTEYNVKAIYEKRGIKAEEALISGKEEDTSDLYSESEVFDRFKLLFDFENSQTSLQMKMKLMESGEASEKSYEESKRQHFKDQGYSDGIQIWGIGHKFAYKDPGHNFEFEGLDSDEEDFIGDEVE